MRERMQALRAQLSDSIHNLHGVFSSRIFVAICRGFWDKLGQVIQGENTLVPNAAMTNHAYI